MAESTDKDAFQQLLDIVASADAAGGIRQGLADAQKDRVRPVTEFFAEFEARHCLADVLP